MPEKQRAVRVSDDDWEAHCALAKAAGVSASDLVVLYIRRANTVATGGSVVEPDCVPQEYASSLKRMPRASAGRGQPVGWDWRGEPIYADERRGPLQKREPKK